MINGGISDHKGHRSRMREKLLEHGACIFDGYELLEMLLYHVIPYKDTKPTAKLLLKTLGGLDGVLGASVDRLCEVQGVGVKTAEFLNTVGTLASREAYFGDGGTRLNIDRYPLAGELAVSFFDFDKRASVMLALFDSSMRLISIKKMSEGGFGSAAIKPRAFMDDALGKSAAAAVVGFVHRYGGLCPTQSELATTGLLDTELEKVAVPVLEHFLVCADTYMGVHRMTRAGVATSNDSIKRFLMSASESDGKYTGELRSEKHLHKECMSKRVLSLILEREELDAVLHSALSEYGGVYAMLIEGGSEIFPEAKRERCEALRLLMCELLRRRYSDSFRFGRRHSESELRDYLCTLCYASKVEWVYVVLKDSEGKTIAVKPICRGIAASVGIIPRMVVEQAIKHRASSVALMHNHPGGCTDPSDEDKQTTALIRSALLTTGIAFDGHYVVAGLDSLRIDSDCDGNISIS